MTKRRRTNCASCFSWVAAHPFSRACIAPTGSGSLALIVNQSLVTLDMEGVLTPEIWIAVAERTGIPALRRTTRDEPDYDKLMKYRIEILDREGITLPKIQEIIAALPLLPGVLDFLNALRE